MLARIGVMRALNRHVAQGQAFGTPEADAGSITKQAGIAVALAGATLAGLSLFRPCAQLSTGPQHLLLIGLAILGKQFHRAREPVLIFPEDIG